MLKRAVLFRIKSAADTNTAWANVCKIFQNCYSFCLRFIHFACEYDFQSTHIALLGYRRLNVENVK